MKYKIEEFSSYLENTMADIKKGKIVDYSISTMNLFARSGSLVEQFLNTLLEKDFKVCYDKTLTDRVFVMPDGHYVFKFLPRGKKKRLLREPSDKISAKNRKKYAKILINLEPRFFQIELGASWWKKLRSIHLLQFFGTSHIKIAPILLKDGSHHLAISTGELSSEGKQTNLTLSFQSAKAYNFGKKILNPEYRVGKKLYETCDITDCLSLIVDYGNHGDPLAMPQIHKIAHDIILDEPKNVLLCSQYNPSGPILSALNHSARSGAHVTIPLQPTDDYRRNDAGFKVLFAKFKKIVSNKVNLPTRPQPSHVKCLIVKHVDDSLSMMFGSDNFESWADTLYRNTEISMYINRAKKTSPEYKMIQEMLDILVKVKEISEAERQIYN
jgi:hypothetical protein